jgi:GYD domain-containing protein
VGSEGGEGFKVFVERVGGQVIDQYTVTGAYDGVVIVDFNDDIGPLATSLRANSGGIYVEALRAYDGRTQRSPPWSRKWRTDERSCWPRQTKRARPNPHNNAP